MFLKYAGKWKASVSSIIFSHSKGLEDSMRRNAVRSIGVEACLFEQKELEQLYAVFKVSASL